MRRKTSILDVLRAAESEAARGGKSSSAKQKSKIHLGASQTGSDKESSRTARVLALKQWFSSELSMPRGAFYLGVILSLVLFFAAFELGKKRGQHAAQARQLASGQQAKFGDRDFVVNPKGGNPGRVGLLPLKEKASFEENASDRKANASVLAANPSETGAKDGDRGLSAKKSTGRNEHEGPWLQILTREDNADGKEAIQAVIEHVRSLGYGGARIYRSSSAKGSSSRRRRQYLALCLPIPAGGNATSLTRELRQLPPLRTKQVRLDFRNLNTLERSKLVR